MCPRVLIIPGKKYIWGGFFKAWDKDFFLMEGFTFCFFQVPECDKPLKKIYLRAIAWLQVGVREVGVPLCMLHLSF